MKNEYKLDQVAIRMVKEPPLLSEYPVKNPESAVKLMSDILKEYDREVLCVVNLKNNQIPINMSIISMGTISSSVAHPREILKSAILSNAAAIMLFHNHPSGNLSPSTDDIKLTDRMQKACSLIGIPVIDHIIIGGGENYFSFKERCILPIPQPPKATDDLSKINLKKASVVKQLNNDNKPKKVVKSKTSKKEQAII